jgi:hypothetical protein
MIVNDLNPSHIPVMPHKTNPPLVVHADAVLAFAAAGQRFQPVARRHPQIVQTTGTVQIFELAPCSILDVRRQPPRTFSAKDAFRFRTRERDNHQGILSHGDNMSRDSHVKKLADDLDFQLLRLSYTVHD